MKSSKTKSGARIHPRADALVKGPRGKSAALDEKELKKVSGGGAPVLKTDKPGPSL